MEKKSPIIRGWDLSHHINQQSAEQLPPKLPKTAKETYREQVAYDYNMDKL